MDLREYTLAIVKSVVTNKDTVVVRDFELEESIMLEIIVDNKDKGAVLGKNGFMITNIKTLVKTKGYLDRSKKIIINVDGV